MNKKELKDSSPAHLQCSEQATAVRSEPLQDEGRIRIQPGLHLRPLADKGPQAVQSAQLRVAPVLLQILRGPLPVVGVQGLVRVHAVRRHVHRDRLLGVCIVLEERYKLMEVP